MKTIRPALKYVFVCALLALSAVILTAQRSPNPPFLPGVTSQDERPNGCIDCHRGAASETDRIDVILAKLDGHPNVAPITKRVPDDCRLCHKPKMPGGTLSFITHLQHYEDPADSDFISSYDGACLSCHALDLNTGEITIKSGAKNW